MRMMRKKRRKETLYSKHGKGQELNSMDGFENYSKFLSLSCLTKNTIPWKFFTENEIKLISKITNKMSWLRRLSNQICKLVECHENLSCLEIVEKLCQQPIDNEIVHLT